MRLALKNHNLLWYFTLIWAAGCVYSAFIMLSKTELLPAKDRLKDADRHLAYVKGSIRHIKSVENKQIVNDLVGAIEAQRKAVEQMLQVLDVVARHDFCNVRLQELQGSDATMVDRKEARKRRVRGESLDPAQGVFHVPAEEELVSSEQSVV
jgi:predicted negative regulator of RcsB-dependent stress response